MFDRIDPLLLGGYLPANNHPLFSKSRDVIKLFNMNLLRCNSSVMVLEDGTKLFSYEVYEILMKLWEGMVTGRRLDEVEKEFVFVPNWYEVIPTFFKKMNGGKNDSGQAKIFYSVIVGTAGIKQGDVVHIMVPGSGSSDYGWSYVALAMVLSQRGASGTIEMYDPIATDSTSVSGNFVLNYHKAMIPEDVDDNITHILDDTFPSALSIRTVTRAVAKGVVVSMKANTGNLVSRLNNEAIINKLPMTVFHQPFYNGQERRVVYNFKNRPITRTVHGCSCYDCLRMEYCPLIEEDWHHIIGFGVRPCFSVKGAKLIKMAYPFYTGREKSEKMILTDLNEVKKLNTYLGLLPQAITPELTNLEEKIVVRKGLGEIREVWCNNSVRGAERVLVSNVTPPFRVSVFEPCTLIDERLPLLYKQTISDFNYYSISGLQVNKKTMARAFSVSCVSLPRSGKILVYAEEEPQRLIVNGYERGFRIERRFDNRSQALREIGYQKLYDASPQVGTQVWVIRPYMRGGKISSLSSSSSSLDRERDEE